MSRAVWSVERMRHDGAVARTSEHQLLLGELACLGILYSGPTHGFAIAARLKPKGDVGRVWSLSRALVYRSLEQLEVRGYVAATGEEPGLAGGTRTIVAATRSGRAQLRRWLTTPVAHLRDLRSELLLKLVIADLCDVDIGGMLVAQRTRVVELAESIHRQVDAEGPVDVVALWRAESSSAALRFLDALASRSGE